MLELLNHSIISCLSNIHNCRFVHRLFTWISGISRADGPIDSHNIDVAPTKDRIDEGRVAVDERAAAESVDEDLDGQLRIQNAFVHP